MNRSRKARPRKAFTLIEILLASAMGLVVIGGVYTLGYCTKVMATKCFAINITGNAARNSMDRVQLLLEQSWTTPVPISSQGATLAAINLSGSAATRSGYVPVFSGSSYMTVTGTGPGLTFDRVLGGPYVVQIPVGGLAGNASSVQVMINSNAQIPPPIPKSGDVLSIYTTAIVSGNDNVVRATVASASPATRQSGIATYTLSLSSALTSTSGTTGIKYTTLLNGTAITPSATLLRPTALVIVPVATTSGTTSELRLIDAYTQTGGNVNVNQNYSVITREIQPTVSTAGTDPTPSGFGIVIMNPSTNSGSFVSMILHVRAQAFDRVLANKQRKDFSTFMGVGSMIPLKSKPD